MREKAFSIYHTDAAQRTHATDGKPTPKEDNSATLMA